MANIISLNFIHSVIKEDDKVQVLSFKGQEAVSSLFQFDIELLSANADLDIDAMLEKQASFVIEIDDEVRTIQGIISHCDAVSQVNNLTLYKVRLVPKLWELSLYQTNEVYLELTIVEIIEQVLTEAGLTTQDYDLSGLQGDYPAWPYKCQYGETHLDFISRLMERDGIYYYFVEGDAGEKVVFCDSLQAQEAITKPAVNYSPVVSMELNQLSDTVSSFINQKARLPHKVLLKDYNDDKPSVDVKGEAIIDETAPASSEIYVWGNNIQTPEEGEQLALIRAEEIKNTKSRFYGESTVIRLMSGHNFELAGHFRSNCNQEYFMLSLEHEGNNPSLLDAAADSTEAPMVYQNTFTAIPADVQFRAEQKTAKPEIHGNLNAFVDAEGDGHYAELDEEGRYRITLPFDRVDRDGGKASHWIRMVQPYGGEGQGMSFPLRKGTEVLLTFIGGDPDRPVIAGTVPNSSQPSITNSDNQTNSVIKTGAGNKIELEDKDGKNRIKLQTGDDKSYMHLGSPNHPGDGWVVVSGGIERKAIAGGQRITLSVDEDGNNQTETTTTNADNAAITAKARTAATQGLHKFKLKDEAGLNLNISERTAAIDGFEANEMADDEELSGKYLIERRSGDKYLWTDGNEFVYGGGNVFNFGNGYEESHINVDLINEQSETFTFSPLKNALNTDAASSSTPVGRAWKAVEKAHERLAKAEKHLAGWEEADGKQPGTYGYISRYSNTRYRHVSNVVKVDEWLGLEEADSGQPQEYDDYGDMNKSGYLYSKAEISQKKSKWESEKESAENDIPGKETAYQDLLTETLPIDFEDQTRHAVPDEHLVEKMWADTYEYQAGRNFAWGDTCDYNFGNGYEENLVKEPYEINKDYPNDKAGTGGPGFGSISSSSKGPGGSFTISLDEDSTCVGKMIGDSYDYTKGNTIEVSDGNAHAYQYGDAYDYVDGDSHEYVDGNSYSEVHGNSKDRYWGNTDEHVFGGASSMHLGGTADMFVGGSTSLTLAANAEMFIGLSTEISVALKAEISTGGTFTADSVAELNSSVTDVDATLTKINTYLSSIAASGTKIDNTGAKVGSGGVQLDAKGLIVMS